MPAEGTLESIGEVGVEILDGSVASEDTEEELESAVVVLRSE